MNKYLKKLLPILLALPIMAGCASSLSSSTSSQTTSTVVPLTVPTNVALTDRLVTWDAVTGATSYDVRLNSSDDFNVTANEFTLPYTYIGSLTIAVRANDATTSTAFSNAISVTAILNLTAPTNLRQDGNQVLWDAVPGATGYIVKIDGVENFTTSTSYTISATSPATVQVLATGRSDQLIVSSGFSAPIYIKVPLATPTGIGYSDGILSWTAVSNAASYEILINDVTPFTSATNSVTIGYDFVGSVNAKVRAIATGDLYVNSAWASSNLTINPLILSKPINVRVEDNVLRFDAVNHATGYEIYVDGTLLTTITETSYTLSPELLAQAGSYVQVKAISTVHTASELSDKVYLGTQLITTEQELRAISGSGSYSLANDIVLTLPWIPLDFAGYFDGSNHTISGIDISDDDSSLSSIGFFATVNAGIIRNLTLEGTISVTSSSYAPSIGGLAGNAMSASIENVSVNMNVSTASTNGVARVGGAIGSINDSTISGLQYSGSIDVTDGISGGLIGRIEQSAMNVTITRSAATGTLTVTGGEQSPTGGFVGQMLDNRMTITESKTGMTVTGPNYVGGFVGYMGYGEISNSYSRGPVTATGTYVVHAGGFAGRVEGYNNRITYSIAMGLVTVSGGTAIYAGSFVGVTPGGTVATIYTNCVYDSTISSRDRIGNPSSGRGDGITGVSSTNLLSLSTYNQSIWDFAGTYPRLDWEL